MQTSVASLEIVRRRHPEWREHQLRWRWLLDSLEGGERYRQAVYGYDKRGLPTRNLIRHKREYPDPRELAIPDSGLLSPSTSFLQSLHEFGSDPASLATDDDYELRRARTPVPTFVAEAVETHLSRIYAREVKRVGCEPLTRWWRDIDGCGTTIDQWMSQAVAPLLLVLGQLDLYMDHPIIPEDETIETRADSDRLGLDHCLASFILPQNMVWWKLDPSGNRYLECLVLESCETEEGPETRYRHWTATESTLYTNDGELVSVTSHPYGRVPIVRVFDGRKFRCRNIGHPRYDGVAERQREYYNRDSELILSDTTQAHPLLQGPEDFVQSDGTVPIGPSWLLPKKKNTQGGAATYEGFDVVAFPKDGAESIRKNKADLRDDVDRDSALVKPTGRDGLAQSGLSKLMDHSDGNNRLAKIAKVLARAEYVAAELALIVISNSPPGPQEASTTEIVYPTEFDLFTAGDMAEATAKFQSLVANAGALPDTEGMMLSRLLRLCMPGLSDTQYAACDDEIEGYLTCQSQRALTTPRSPSHTAAS
jgi:hypothetical protein